MPTTLLTVGKYAANKNINRRSVQRAIKAGKLDKLPGVIKVEKAGKYNILYVRN
jgi:hypothetical protein